MQWIEKNHRYNPKSWKIDIIAKRVIAWISNSKLTYEDSGPVYKNKFNNIIKKQINYDGKIVWDESMPAGPNRRNVSIELARQKINFNPVISLEDGIKKTIDWYIGSKNI